MQKSPRLRPDLPVEGESITWIFNAVADATVLSVMLTTMPSCVVTSVVGRFVLRAIRAPVNAGSLAEAANGQSHQHNYLVDTPKMISPGKSS
jgi:hypothetical protein